MVKQKKKFKIWGILGLFWAFWWPFEAGIEII